MVAFIVVGTWKADVVGVVSASLFLLILLLLFYYDGFGFPWKHPRPVYFQAMVRDEVSTWRRTRR